MRLLKLTYGIVFIFCCWLIIPTASHLDRMPVSFVLFDQNESLLGARIAVDEQWRFPEMNDVPYKFEKAIITFEDKNFYKHFGLDVKAIIRALYLNIKKKRVVSGASTLSMQLMRLHDPGSKRTVVQKICEILKAIKFEAQYSKKDILQKYVTHAPFGGNIVGLEAASWRYLGKSPFNLSWAETCMLAVLPNGPSLIHLGKNRDRLLVKRNSLLKRLFELSIIDETEYKLALLEKIAPRPEPLPNLAPHFLEKVKAENSDLRYVSTLQLDKQTLLNEVVASQDLINKQKGINNLGVLIVNNHTKEIEAYVGNTSGRKHQNYNNMIERPRSSGSILKPILYAMAMHNGMITPDGLANDVPLSIGGFSPKNYNRNHFGVVPYSTMIAKSLNVPAVNLLKDYGIGRFLNDLKSLGFSTFKYDSDHYGLPLILGGGEVNLIDLVHVYSGMAETLNLFLSNNSKYLTNGFNKITYDSEKKKKNDKFQYDPRFISAGAIWSTFNAMLNVERPNEQGQWQKYNSSQAIHWKTGTSYGNRDAWAVGVTSDYTIGVWVGNSNGDPQPDIVGVSAAGAVLFDCFNFLEISQPFEIPYDDLQEKIICKHSGQVASRNCKSTSLDWIPVTTLANQFCNFCQRTFLNAKNGRMVYQDCTESSDIVDTSYFVLPPLASYYYKQNNPTYSDIPMLDFSCQSLSTEFEILAFEYPREDVTVYLPNDLSGVKEKCVFKAKHQMEDAKVFWHINNDYLGSTEDIHHMAVDLKSGNYKLTIQDEFGMSQSHWISVISE